MTIDIDQIASDLNGKADKDLTNVIGSLSASAETYFSKIGMPSSTSIDLTLGTSGSDYVAPANGYFTICKHGTAGQLVAFENLTGGHVTTIVSLGAETDCRLFIPAKEGDTVRLWWNANGTLNFFKFVYAEGQV